MSETHSKQACSERVYEITTAALPLSCPMPGMRLWDAHPKIYLPIEATGSAQCSYCSAQYILTDYTPTLTEANKTDVEYALANR